MLEEERGTVTFAHTSDTTPGFGIRQLVDVRLTASAG
jgi:hypothetical protein